MLPTQDEFHHCPHCGRRTRHAVARERVLAPTLWCLSCFHLRVEAAETAVGGVMSAAPSPEGTQTYRLAG
jgi:uncharacterized Zn finger protein